MKQLQEDGQGLDDEAPAELESSACLDKCVFQESEGIVIVYIYTRVYRYMYIYRTELFQSISSNSFYRYRFISLDLQQLLGCALGHCYKTRF